MEKKKMEKEYCRECGELLDGDVVQFGDDKFHDEGCFDSFIDMNKIYCYYENGKFIF